MHVLAALRALTASGAPRPRVLVIAEGGEEVGSPGLQGVVDRLVERVRPSVVLVCDTEQAAPGIPSVTVSQRGCVRFSLTVDAGGPEVHAGRFGGAVVDPARGLGVLIARLETLVAGPTFRAGPPPRIPGLHVRSDGEVRRALGTRKVLTGGCLDDRVTECSAFSVTRLAAGSRSAAVPSRAEADVDVRLPPGVDARAVAEALRLCAGADGGPGGRVGIKLSAVHSGRWFVPSPRLRAAVDRASLATFGAPVALVRSGGSLPAATILARATGSSPVLLGLAPSGSGAHGPDEFLDVASWHQGVGLLVRLLTDLADASESGVRRSRGVAPVCRHVALDGTSD
jgi:succinyl-diaminopimelate desuccinylase